MTGIVNSSFSPTVLIIWNTLESSVDSKELLMLLPIALNPPSLESPWRAQSSLTPTPTSPEPGHPWEQPGPSSWNDFLDSVPGAALGPWICPPLFSTCSSGPWELLPVQAQLPGWGWAGQGGFHVWDLSRVWNCALSLTGALQGRCCVKPHYDFPSRHTFLPFCLTLRKKKV